MKKIYFLMGASVVLILSACHSNRHAEESESEVVEDHSDEIVLTESQAEAAGITTEDVVLGTFCHVIKASGQVLPARGEERTVVSSVAGIVSFDAAALPGRAVSRGQRLAVVSSRSIQGGDPVERARVSYERALSSYERAVPLAEERIISRSELEQLKAEFEEARIAYQALSGSSTSTGSAVTASMDGYVKQLFVGEGDYVNAGDPLLTLTRTRRLQLRADLPERYFSEMPYIVSARFRTPYADEVYDLEEMNGCLLTYAKTVESESHYLPLLFEFDNTGDIIPGAFVDIFLIGAARPDVVTLPLSAITEEQGLHFVYVRDSDEDVYHKRQVFIGSDDGCRVEIRSGVSPGDRVVVRGAMRLRLASSSSSIPAHTHSH